MKKVMVSVGLGMLVLGGCYSMSNGSQELSAVNAENLGEKIAVGDSKEQVLANFGQPMSQMASADGGQTWTYTFARVGTTAGSYVPFVGGLNSEVESRTLTVEFNDDGLVEDYALNSTTN